MNRALRTFAFVAVIACGVASQAADLSYRGSESYAGAVRSPEDFFDMPLGSRFTPHHEVMRYCRYVAEASDRVQFVEYGRTAEGRELIYLVVGRPEALSDLEGLKERQLQLADPRRPQPGLEALLDPLPAVVWLSYNVHGSEASPTETALQTLYHLADGNDPVTRKILDRVVVVLDPLLNPDGRERYLSWYHSVASAGGNPDPESREHSEPWPGGRTNHYYFDLNRDWAWQSQIETRTRIVHYLRWNPLVHVDFHEMSPESSYFFFPAESPINTNLPEHTVRWGQTFGEANAAAFDRFGWKYYTAESFDLFYPGYGDTWPSFHGAIGMTYEQGGGGRAGLQYRRRTGEILTLRDRLHHHFVTSLATLECVADRKEDLQRSFREFRAGAIDTGRTGQVVEYLFPPAEDWERLHTLIDLLLRQGIEVERTLDDAVAESLQTYGGDEKEAVKIPAGTYVVPLAQPAGRLARALLEPEAEVTTNRFYDVSAWSLPFSTGVEAYYTGTRVAVERESVTSLKPKAGRVARQAGYAYLLPWKGIPAVRALIELQRRGLQVRLVPEAIEVGERNFARGTLVVDASPDRPEVHAAVAAVARECHVEFVPVDSGLTDVGIDLGSDKIAELKRARIAVAAGEGTSTSSFGAIWSLFEGELSIPFTAFALDDLGSLDLDRYDVVVFPEGRVQGQLSKETKARLVTWVRKGGVIVALGRSAFALAKEGAGLVSVSSQPTKKAPDKKDGKKDEEKEGSERLKLKDLRERSRERQVPGNIFQVDLDTEHPLTFGLPQSMHVFLGSTRSFALGRGGGDVAAFTEDPAVSGYISEENIDKIKRRVYLAEQRMGRGKVVLFAGDPNFRLFWRGTTPLFLNAVLLRAQK